MSYTNLRVLIAEDNEINLEVCRHFLSQIGIEDTAAAPNGVEVLRLLEPDPKAFDLILMDVRMPELDGIATTREILARWPAPDDRPKIVALTAHAFVEETRRCLEAGMDACLSKPLRRQDLDITLSQALARPMMPADFDSPSQMERAPQKPLIDWKQFDMIVDAPDSPCVEIFHRFLETTPGLLMDVAEAAGAGHLVRAAELCHQLKGTSSSFGLAAFADAMKTAEYALRSDLSPALPDGDDWLSHRLTQLTRSRDEIRAQRGI
ncbi:MAG: response regulator [Verrucomicrobiales bacterium]|nr:response regulator [Verrucomicrobiales bacterium]